MFGKVHGLENVALADEQEYIATNGDPFKLQRLVDKVNDSSKPLPEPTFDKLLESIHQSMDEYKQAVDNNQGREFNPSDRKRLLSLPFFLAKRSEMPEPKKGQKEWAIFKDMYGKEWDHFDTLTFDQEDKITEFNYEKFIPKHLL